MTVVNIAGVCSVLARPQLVSSSDHTSFIVLEIITWLLLALRYKRARTLQTTVPFLAMSKTRIKHQGHHTSFKSELDLASYPANLAQSGNNTDQLRMREMFSVQVA